MNRRTREEEAVDAHARERAGTHPLRQPGAGRRLYAAGLSLQLVGLLGAFTALVGTALSGQDVLPLAASFAPLAGSLLLVTGQRLCARAWWHVPLRSPDAAPDAVELAFWSVVALALVVVAVVVAVVPAEPDAFDLWLLVALSCLLALLPETQRPGPEPPPVQAWHTLPLAVAAVAVLVVGAVTGLLTAVAVAVVLAVLAAGLVAQRAWLRHRYR